MSKMLKTSAEHRKCMFPNCPRILSIYNHDTYCHIHQEEGHQGQIFNKPSHRPGHSPTADWQR